MLPVERAGTVRPRGSAGYSGLQQPFQDILHQEPENAERENEEQDESAELSGVGLPGEVPDDP